MPRRVSFGSPFGLIFAEKYLEKQLLEEVRFPLHFVSSFELDLRGPTLSWIWYLPIGLHVHLVRKESKNVAKSSDLFNLFGDTVPAWWRWPPRCVQRVPKGCPGVPKGRPGSAQCSQTGCQGRRNGRFWVRHVVPRSLPGTLQAPRSKFYPKRYQNGWPKHAFSSIYA